MKAPPRKELVAALKELGSQQAVARRYGVAVSQVNRWVHKYELPTRENRQG